MHKKPIMRDREKLRVARAERKRPRRRREKDFMRRNCWVDGFEQRVRMAARIIGRTMFMMAKSEVACSKYCGSKTGLMSRFSFSWDGSRWNFFLKNLLDGAYC